MDDAMVARWNSVVGKHDTVYHMGDFSWGRYEDIYKILKRLNGIIHLTLGNHDQDIIKNRSRLEMNAEVPSPSAFTGTFASIKDYREVTIDGRKVVMMHFPLAVWHKNHHGAFHVFGHCHGSFLGFGKSMDVGWDTNNLGEDHIPGPIPWLTVHRYLFSREMEILDHHDPKDIR